MTTDNRTNEPTPEQVEAAAKAIYESYGNDLMPPWENPELDQWVERSVYRNQARAVLVAALEAEPQAEALPETGNELRDEDGDLISSGKHLRVLHQGGYVCDTCVNVLGINVRWDRADRMEGHPVLPSSGVDEDKLAEVIGGVLAGQEAMHCNRVWEAWGHGTMSEDDFSLVSDDEEAVTEIARAVAEWFMGQEGESREDR